MKQRFPFLRPRRLNEKCYTDTFEWKVAGKVKYTQIFFLAKSRLVVCISILCVTKVCETYEEFSVNYGAPTRIIADKHQAENKGKKVMSLLLKYQVERGFTVAG